MSTEIIYTDGACSKNGTVNASGGFGMFIAKSSLLNAPLKLNQKGKQMSLKNETVSEVYYVTNIRMEGLAIVSTLALYADMLILRKSNSTNILDRLNSIDPFNTNDMKVKYLPKELKINKNQSSDVTIEIVTDSLFWINVIETWMPNWIKKNILFEKKNVDILLMLHYFWELFIQNNITVKLTHVKSHQKGKRTEHADGNDVADVLATSSVNNTNHLFQLK